MGSLPYPSRCADLLPLVIPVESLDNSFVLPFVFSCLFLKFDKIPEVIVKLGSVLLKCPVLVQTVRLHENREENLPKEAGDG